MTHRVEHMDALAFLATLPDSSVGLILTDPPYFRVKPQGWDRQWTKARGFLDWLDTIAAEWARVLKPNGTLVCFAASNASASPGATLAARVECLLAERFNVVASCVWVKEGKHGEGTHLRHHMLGVRSHIPQTERAIICEHFGADNIAKGEAGYNAKCDELRGFVFEPLRAYLAGEWGRAGLTTADANEATGTQMAGHWLTTSQWAMPTRKHYETLRARANRDNGDHLRREYDDLRREYDDLRREYDDLKAEFEALRRPFDATAGRHFTDVWTYHTVAPGGNTRHPCAKPREMADDLVRQCSRPGDVVLDTFAGSGVFLAGAAAAGRIAWGCDADEWWATVARQSVEAVADAPVACETRPEKPVNDAGQMGLAL